MSRYVVFDIIGPEISPEEAEYYINSSVFDLIGEINLALCDYRFLGEKYSKNLGIIKCNAKGLNQIRAALTLTRNIGEKVAIVNVRGVSGTIKTASRKFLDK